MRFSRGFSALAFTALLAASPALAGFEWVAPKEDMSKALELPTPKPGTPRIATDPMGLDPLPPLTIDQENGTRATVYRPAPAASAPMPEMEPMPAALEAMPETAPIAPRRRASPMVSEQAPREQARLKTLSMGSNDEPRMAGQISPPIIDNPNQPQQLRMADKLVVPDDIEPAPSHEGEPLPEASGNPGNVAINPTPLATPAPMAAAPAYAAPAPAPAIPNAPILEGFGSDLPLALALQQIVPPEYAYSFGGGVNPGESVSWEGGKAWTQVLSEMLDSEGMRATIRGRSIQIQSTTGGADGMVSPRAEAESSITTAQAEALAETAPAAGDASEPAEVAVETAIETPAEPVEKVEAVPPVYPPEVLGKTAPQAAPSEPRVLASISENTGLRIEDVKETVQMQGSKEAAAKAKAEVTQRAVGLLDDVPAAPPETKTEITSFAVTTTTKKVIEEAPAATPAAVTPTAEPVVAAPAVAAPAVISKEAEPANAPIASPKAAVSGKLVQRRTAITDPGEQPSRQPEVQSLNTQNPDITSAPDEPMQLAAADIPQTPPSLIPAETPKATSSADDQRKRLEDMARQQGVVLDAKNYNNDALGKIFNNGIAPAAGEETLPTKVAAPPKQKAAAPSLPSPSLPAPDVGLEKKPAAPAVAEPTATTKVPVAAAPAHKTETAQQPAPAAAPASLIDPPAATEAVEVEEDVTDGAEDSTQAAPQAAAPLAAAPATTPSTSRPTAVDQPIKRIRSGNAGTPNTAAAKSSAMMWEAAKGADLKDTLTEWSKNSTMKLVWNAKANYAIGTTIMVYGSFNDAMKALFAEGSKSGSFPVMRFTDDGAGRSTLVVDDKSS